MCYYLSLSLSLYIYIYISICVYIYIYIIFSPRVEVDLHVHEPQLNNCLATMANWDTAPLIIWPNPGHKATCS